MSDRWVIYVVLGRSSRARAWTVKARLTQEQKAMVYGVLGMVAYCVLIGLALIM